MRKLIVVGILFLAGCSAKHSREAVALEQKLEKVKKNRTEIEQKIAAIEMALARQEIVQIRQELEEFKKEKGDNSLQEHDHFIAEREKLAAIIQNTPGCAEEAQGVLDQILALITRLSNEKI